MRWLVILHKFDSKSFEQIHDEIIAIPVSSLSSPASIKLSSFDGTKLRSSSWDRSSSWSPERWGRLTPLMHTLPSLGSVLLWESSRKNEEDERKAKSAIAKSEIQKAKAKQTEKTWNTLPNFESAFEGFLPNVHHLWTWNDGTMRKITEREKGKWKECEGIKKISEKHSVHKQNREMRQNSNLRYWRVDDFFSRTFRTH